MFAFLCPTLLVNVKIGMTPDPPVSRDISQTNTMNKIENLIKLRRRDRFCHHLEVSQMIG